MMKFELHKYTLKHKIMFWQLFYQYGGETHPRK